MMTDMKILIVTVTPSYKDIRGETKRAVENLERGSNIVDWLIVTEQFEDAGDEWRVSKTIWHNLEKARRVALMEGYDYLLSLEWDIVPPQGALLNLMDNKADVAIGLYPERPSKVGSYLGGKLLVYNPGNCVPEAEEKVRSGLPFQINRGCGGFGYLLINRDVMQSTKFSWEWYGNVYEKGFKVVIDPRVLCDHVDRDGTIVKPVTSPL
jgi:hypothetical protein